MDTPIPTHDLRDSIDKLYPCPLSPIEREEARDNLVGYVSLLMEIKEQLGQG